MSGSRIYLRSGVYVDVEETPGLIAKRFYDATAETGVDLHNSWLTFGKNLIAVAAIEAVVPR